MSIITTTNQKGGVGKTTTALSIAHYMALNGRRVLLADLDPQGQCATALGIDPEPGVFNALVNPQEDIRTWIRKTGRDNLYLLPGNRSTATAQVVVNAENRPIDCIRQLFKPVSKEYDYIVFDTAPSAGGLQERGIWAADYVLIPTATDFLSSDGLAQIMNMLGQLRNTHSWKGKLLGILPTFFDDTTNESKSSLEELKKNFSKAVFSPIHRATLLRECTSTGKTIFEADLSSRAAQEYKNLAKAILKLSEK